jgi:NAD(P)-dependent dehydrogenase (short-subunit alcohol dehydrogenase family)
MAGSEIPSQLGKTAVVTGATAGLGYETALALAKAGSEVILTGRDDQKGQSAIDKISRDVIGAKLSYEHLDLANLASVADFAQRMQARRSLDLLINNAGVMALPRRQTTADGFEVQFGTNHLGHFALTARLMPLLRRASGARVVSLSSLAHRTGLIDFNDLGFARTNLFTSGPGGLVSLASGFAAPLFGHSAADGARPILFAATSPDAKPGGYSGPGGFGELRGAPARALIMPQARDAAAAARLWDVSGKLVSTSFE